MDLQPLFDRTPQSSSTGAETDPKARASVNLAKFPNGMLHTVFVDKMIVKVVSAQTGTPAQVGQF
ncbi:hypothetical protein [Rhizobium mesoamericanum]|nr:hypothetical protein [Rhizobium mesoamericanum]